MSERSPSTPRIDRPEIPAEYGMSKATQLVDWGRVEERLTADRVYWIVTVGQGGRPRVRPIDGTYVDGVIYVGGSPKTRWYPEYGMTPDFYRANGAIAIRTRKVIAWTDISKDPTRFRF